MACSPRRAHHGHGTCGRANTGFGVDTKCNVHSASSGIRRRDGSGTGTGARQDIEGGDIDSNLIYARYVIANGAQASAKEFKIGVVGGVGPAATVDFVGKIVRNTKANKDQDHIKLVVEQNPQIPDRTENLIGNGTDPTIALYSPCKKLESADADIIAIPCNTAHAFVERIQPYLGIPVINMLTATVEHIQVTLPKDSAVGLLATNGTLKSGIYAEAAANAEIKLLVPDDEYQAKVMNAIYGDRGVKAGLPKATTNKIFLQPCHIWLSVVQALSFWAVQSFHWYWKQVRTSW